MYVQFALKAQETRQKLYDEIRALEIEKQSKLSKLGEPPASSTPRLRAPTVSSERTPPPTPSLTAVEDSDDDDDDEKALGSLGLKIDSV